MLQHCLQRLRVVVDVSSRKFPDEADWRSYLTQWGGSSNAYTSSNNINFYFGIGNGGLQGSLERFAQFFVSPLFTKTSIAREIQAVHAENMKNMLSDGWREQQLYQSLSNASFPWHKFSTGNLQTLGNVPMDDLHDGLLSFFNTHFVGPKIRVVILGASTMNDLEK